MSGEAKMRAALAGRDAHGGLRDPVSGVGFVMTEAERVNVALDATEARAVPHEACSYAVPIAPARGPSVVYRPTLAYLTDSGPRVGHEPMPDGAPARVAGPLEVLERASRRRDSGPLFTTAQHQAAADYQALFERVNGGRVKCSSLEAQTGSGGAGSVMDAICDDIARLRRMDGAIGREAVLSPRGVAAHPGRRTVWSNDLVHWVLVRAEPLKTLLVLHGWSGDKALNRERMRQGLAAAMDRLHGL